MRLSFPRALTIAKREYLTTVRRKAFVFTLIFFPAYLAAVSAGPGMLASRSIARRLSELHVIAVIDSSGALASGPPVMKIERRENPGPLAAGKQKKEPQKFSAEVKFYPDFATAESDLRAGKVSTILVAPVDYLATGRVRRYQKESGLFGSAEEQSVRTWLSRAMVAGSADSVRAERAAQPAPDLQQFTLDRQDRWVLKDDTRDLVDVFLPLGMAMLLGMSIVIGGQYLLQGVTEEKESRILESLLCTVSSEELMVGKLLGLGTAGMTLVLAWMSAGLLLGGPIAILIGARFTPLLVFCAIAYFALGYLFYASLMTAIGAIASNLREAQQIAYVFTIANFAPFFVFVATIDQPNGTLPTVLSMFPLTASTSMMMRLSTGASIPLWQIGVSLGVLFLSAVLAVVAGSRIFRTGLLLYGKTPNLPEILRWAREA
jgi:ABC-2 type transport system permease protein